MSELEVKIKPLGTRVLVRPVEESSRTSSGIYIPDTAKEKPQRGEVVAIGDEEEEIKVKVGQIVLFPKYVGTDIKLEGIDHIIMESDDILALIEE
jgi:chaperonin GroES